MIADLWPSPAHADCSSPAGPAGRIEYFSTSEQKFKYCDGANWMPWVNALDDIANVSAPSPSNGNVLMYSAGASGWVPGTVSGGTGSMPICADGDSAKYSPVDGWVCAATYDNTPNGFVFTDQIGVAVSTLIMSDIKQITGMQGNIAVSISGTGSPQFRVCSDSLCSSVVHDWSSSNSIQNNQYLQLRLTSDPVDGVTRSATVGVGPTVTDNWSVRTIYDDTPDAFSFTDVTLQPLNTLITSNSLTITGITSTVNVSVSGAGTPKISINGGGWVSSGTITDGQTLEVRLTSAATSSTLRSATVTVGTVSDQWDVTTQDATPVAFSFTDVTIQPQNTLITSDSATITNITGSVPVSVSGTGSPKVRVNGGSWTAGPTTITDGQTLEVQLTSAATDTTARTATVTVGTVSDIWSVTTQDVSPSGLSFTDLLYQTTSTLITSDIVTIGSLSGNVATSISGTGSPEYRICTAADCSAVSVDWTNAPGTLTTGTYLQLRLTTSASVSTMRSATMTVGSVSNQWDVTTLDPGLYAWGDNFRWEMGLSSQMTALTPVQVDSSASWTTTSAGQLQTCGIKAGALFCWGQNSNGATGLGTNSGVQATPAQVGTATNWTVVAVAKSGYFSTAFACGISGGALYCWGENSYGKTGLGVTSGEQLTPAQVGTATNWTDVETDVGGGGHSCGISGGALYCWGNHSYGQTGLGLAGGNTATPTQVGSATDWTVVSAGGTGSCGIRSGALYCWGSNAHGATGLGTTTGNQTTPAQVGSATDWTAVSSGGEYPGGTPYTCGIRGGALYCWGINANGRTGLGTAAGDQTTPAQVGSATDWTSITTGSTSSGPQTCGVRGGAVYCWGSNGYSGGDGKLGIGNITADQLSPVLVSSGGWTVVSAGTDHTMAIFAP